MGRFCLIFVLAVGLSGCATVHMQKETKDGGRVSIFGPPDDGFKKAAKLMAKKCPNGYEEVERGIQGSGTTMHGGGSSTEVPARYIEFKCKSVQ